MKKSHSVVLSAVLLAAISSCNSRQDEWSDGRDANGRTRDTAIYRNGHYHYYRYFGAGWFILNRNNMINTGRYMPASSFDIARPTFTPRFSSGRIRSGGFGHSSHSSGG